MNAVSQRSITLTVRPGTPADRNRVLPLIYFESYVHQQPGWRPPLEFMEGDSPFFLLLQDDQLQAAWLASVEAHPAAWLRLFVVAHTIRPEVAWQALWPPALEALQRRGVQALYALAFKRWFSDLLEQSGFRQVSRIRNLAWHRQPLPPARPLPEGVVLRPMEAEDIAAAVAVDWAAFESPWQIQPADLQRVFREAVVASVVEDAHGLIGYQVSTAGPGGGHLARLAVHPRAHRRGIGFALVHHVLSVLSHQGAEWVTVNTWGENEAAIRLYLRFGFHYLPEEQPVYRLTLA